MGVKQSARRLGRIELDADGRRFSALHRWRDGIKHCAENKDQESAGHVQA
jgi:hypothetical protein